MATVRPKVGEHITIKTASGSKQVVVVKSVYDYEDETQRGYFIDYKDENGRWGDKFVLESEDHSKKLVKRSGMPYYDLAKSFKWSYYGKHGDAAKKIANSYLEHWHDWRKNGRGLFICSETNGSGKTYLACCIGNELIVRYNSQVEFVTMNDYIALMSENRDRAAELRDAVLLILDDFGAQNEKQDWISDAVFRLVDHRYRTKLPTIFTSNMPMKKSSKNDRVTSRIFELSQVVKMPEVSVREIIATKAKEEFLQSVL